MTVNYFIVKSVTCCLLIDNFMKLSAFWKVEFEDIFHKLRALTKCWK